MGLREYFENTEGLGVLATADNDGKVNLAIYARPHVMEDGSLVFIMTDRLTHKNVQSNSYATYLFKENGSGYRGKRIYLTKIREEENSPLINSLSRRPFPSGTDSKGPKFLVYFKLQKERPLIGG